ncbi:MAG: hypothetical protein V1885_01055 [Candidatus Brennerbacteria bacterium]
MFYDIHGIVKVKVVSRSPAMKEGYDHYFRAFKTTPFQGEADYEVYDFSDFKRPLDTTDLVGGWRGFAGGAFSPRERYAFTWKNGKVKEFASYANRATNFWLQLLLVPRGMSLVHAAALEIKGKGVLFPGMGGVGKTLLIAAMRDRADVKFFGDDLVMVSREGNCYSYPSDFSIYRYHLTAFSELNGSPAAWYLKRRKIFAPYYFLKRALNFVAKRTVAPGRPLFEGWGAPYVKVPAESLIPKEREGITTNLGISAFLKRGSGEEIVTSRMDAKELTARLLRILHLELGEGMNFLRLLARIGSVNENAFIRDEEGILGSCAGKLACYEVNIPERMDPRTYRARITETISNLIT